MVSVPFKVSIPKTNQLTCHYTFYLRPVRVHVCVGVRLRPQMTSCFFIGSTTEQRIATLYVGLLFDVQYHKTYVAVVLDFVEIDNLLFIHDTLRTLATHCVHSITKQAYTYGPFLC